MGDDGWSWDDYAGSFGIGSDQPDFTNVSGIDPSYTGTVELFSGLNPTQANALYSYAMTLDPSLSDEEYSAALSARADILKSGGAATEPEGTAIPVVQTEPEGAAIPVVQTEPEGAAAPGASGSGTGANNSGTGANNSGNGAKPLTGLPKMLTDMGLMDASGKINPLVGLGLSALTRQLGGGSSSSPNRAGYQGGIPQYTATRQQLAPTDATRVPGSAGRSYFSDVTFAPKPAPVTAAYGGLMGMAQGRYLSGGTDGMADKIPANIDGKQEARLSHGEFVVPADVVSHLGNGNSEAGAQQLYSMMDRIRKARTGNPKQGKQITPQKFLPR